jgi:hypothetical protein
MIRGDNYNADDNLCDLSLLCQLHDRVNVRVAQVEKQENYTEFL